MDTPSYTQSFTKKVEASHLKLGMYVSKLDRPWEETPFLLQGFIIQNPDQIREIKEHCDFVYIDQQKSVNAQNKPSTPGTRVSTAVDEVKKAKRKRKFGASLFGRNKETTWEKRLDLKRQDLEEAEKTYKSAFNLVQSTMQNIKLGKSIDSKACKEAVAASVDSIFHQPEAMLLMSRLKSKDEYTEQHSLNVSVVSIALGRYIGLDRKQLNEVGLCGLLHDMGKMLTPDEVLNKPGRLTEDELKVMQQHPVDGHSILSSTEGITHDAIHVAHAHHERLDGSGYPQGLVAKDLSMYNKIVTIADVYDAITSDRVYKKGETVEATLQIIHNHRGTAFDPVIATQFIEQVGIYPLGTLVELHNGEIGIVMHTSPEKRLRPWIKIVLDIEHKLIEPHLVDLSKPDVDKDGNPYWIKMSHNPSNFDINLLKHVHQQLA